jgi:hypothetical protein
MNESCLIPCNGIEEFGEFFSGAALLWASGMTSQPVKANSNHRYNRVVLKNAGASLIL